MKEPKDPEIKLFGKKISLPENGRISPDDESNVGSPPKETSAFDRDLSLLDFSDEGKENSLDDEEGDFPQKANEDPVGSQDQVNHAEAQEKVSAIEEESTNTRPPMDSDDNPNSAATEEETTAGKAPNENDQGEDATNSQQKTLKKPDKILPCPRCNSMDTKFCYYNNYNVNQPRHFCKSCQRYWTDGGTMRNVPVGAGRRKNKNSASHCRHIAISEALQAARIDVPNGLHHPALKTNGTVLSFGSDMPLCESMASVLNLAEKKAPNGTRNGFYNLEQRIPVACKPAEKGDDSSSGSSGTTSNSMVEKGKDSVQEPMVQNINGYPPQIACLPGVPWPYPWSSAVPVPTICPSGFPLPFIPAPFWNCGVPGPWGVPWLSPPSPSTNQKSSGSGPNSQTLGKHSRDGDLLKPNEPEVNKQVEIKKDGSILVPKTLRINDPDDAAKSSIWQTLGIKNESVNRKGLFKGFQPKDNEKNHMAASSLLLQANPAALSRSLSFQENA